MTMTKMKFEDIKFSEGSGKRRTGLGLLARGGYWVPKAEVELAWHAASHNCPLLDWSIKQTTQTLLVDPEWPTWRTPKRNRLGRAIRYFVDNAMLDLWVVNPEQTGTKKYLHRTLSPIGLRL